MDNTFDANKGLFLARSILHKISQLGLPVGTEFLDPISPQFVADLISFMPSDICLDTTLIFSSCLLKTF